MKLRTLAPVGLLLLAAAAFADTAVYDLDAKNASEIAKAIQATLTARCATVPSTVLTVSPSMCHVELLPTNQLLVEAPAPAQSQIAAALKAIAARNATATPAPRITLQYWVLYGDPGKPDAADASLKPLDAVLQQLKRVHGELGFSVQDTARLTAQSGSVTKSTGGALRIDQSVRAHDDSLDLATQLSFVWPNPDSGSTDSMWSLNVNVTVRRGEFVVLGERTDRRLTFEDKSGKSDKSRMVFFVVNWPQGQ